MYRFQGFLFIFLILTTDVSAVQQTTKSKVAKTNVIATKRTNDFKDLKTKVDSLQVELKAKNNFEEEKIKDLITKMSSLESEMLAINRKIEKNSLALKLFII